MRRACIALVVVASVSSFLSLSTCAAQTKRALLIGINIYQPANSKPRCVDDGKTPDGCTAGRWKLPQFHNLNGSVNDAHAMADVLELPKYGFLPVNVVQLTDPAQTTHDGILAAMQKYLVEEPKPGDTVVFYYAGHGSLRRNSKGHKLNIVVNGPGSSLRSIPVDSTIVPSDAYLGKYDVLDREMTRIFNNAVAKGVHLTAIFDSCHSGDMTRGVERHDRSLDFDPRDIHDGHTQLSPVENKTNPGLILSAAQQDQTAEENPLPDDPDVSDGDFTVALVTALKTLPADEPAAEVFEVVKAQLEERGDIGQFPQMDAEALRRSQPLLGPPAVTTVPADLAGKVWTAVVDVNTDDGEVTLDMGKISDVGVGSVFVPETTATDAPMIQLTVSELTGIDRSIATLSPTNAAVKAGDLFVLQTRMHADLPVLRVWMPPANLTEEQVRAAAAQVQAAKVVSVSDPAEDPWNERLSWDGSAWLLQAATPRQDPVQSEAAMPVDALVQAVSEPVNLGAPLTASALKRNLKPGSKVWVDLPPSRELAARLKPSAEDASVQSAATASVAEYVLTGSLAQGVPQYAWFHRKEFAAGPHARRSLDHTPGCSTTSPYPVRRDWQPMPDAAGLTTGAGHLMEDAGKLAQANQWLTMSADKDMASGDSFYQLQLQRNGKSLASGDTVLGGDKGGDVVSVVLHGDGSTYKARWVYVLDIDCQGNGTQVSRAESYPNEGDNPDSGPDNAKQQAMQPETIPLPSELGAHLKLQFICPCGVETFMMLSTKDPLANPFGLESKAAARDAGDAMQSWGLDRVVVRSVPIDVMGKQE